MPEVKELSFHEVIQTLDGGGTVEEIRDHLRKVTQAVHLNGGAGSVTIKLNVKRSGKKNERQLSVADSVTSTLPKVLKDDTIFFATDDGGLTRNNPDQLSLIDGGR